MQLIFHMLAVITWIALIYIAYISGRTIKPRRKQRFVRGRTLWIGLCGLILYGIVLVLLVEPKRAASAFAPGSGSAGYAGAAAPSPDSDIRKGNLEWIFVPNPPGGEAAVAAANDKDTALQAIHAMLKEDPVPVPEWEQLV